MTHSSIKNRRFFGFWRKNSNELKHVADAGNPEKRPNDAYQGAPILPPRLQRDIGLMGGVFATALRQRS